MSATNQESTHWVSVTALIFCGVVAAMQLGKVAIGAPLLQEQLNFSFSHIGWLTALFSILGMLGGIPIGTLVMRHGQRRSVILGLLILAFGSLASTAGTSIAWLLAFRMVEGLGFVLVIVACPALINRATHPRHKNLTLSLWSCFMPFGMCISIFIGGWFTNWTWLWWLCAFLPLVALALVLRFTSPPPADLVFPRFKEIAAQLKQLLSTTIAPVFTAVFALYSLMYFALFSFLPLLLVERMDFSVAQAGYFTAFAALANATGNLGAASLISAGIERGRLLLIACIVMIACGISLFFANPAPILALVLCLVFSGTGGLIPATVISSVPRIAPTAAAIPVTIGLTMQGSNMGQVVGPALVGSSVEHFGWHAAGIIILLSGSFACFLILRYLSKDTLGK
ncbi:MAG TPA: MFS transporter [Paenalcaligenes sp.]|nr:MFS transporter [Paenalcaligenes sp.]